jgi:hypothetical protein
MSGTNSGVRIAGHEDCAQGDEMTTRHDSVRRLSEPFTRKA